MRTTMYKFTQWYKNKNQNRQMTWSFLHGQVEMQTSFAAKRYTVVVNCYQAAILDLFNEKDQYSS